MRNYNVITSYIANFEAIDEAWTWGCTNSGIGIEPIPAFLIALELIKSVIQVPSLLLVQY